MNLPPPDFSFFQDPQEARNDYDRIAAGIPDSHLIFLGRLFSEIERHPSPDSILSRFERLTRSAVNRVSFCKMLCDFPPIIARLVRLFSCSRYLSETIVHDFQYAYFLISPELHCPPVDRNAIEKQSRSISEHSSYSINRKMHALRTLKRREILKIGIRDYILDVPFERTVEGITTLAEACIEASRAIHYLNFAERFGSPSTPFAVIALGKLGGAELNYSSDVDLMFVYRDEGTVSRDGKEISHHEFFNQLSAALVSSVARDSSEGVLYRVDTRLRPDGDSGPLARSASSFMHYYEARGQLWERQMLIKARPVAGDMEFGNQFLEGLSPFIYPKTFFESPLKEIARMKWRLEEQHGTGDMLNIKIHAGGIRDIEFIVQALQLINGGACRAVRSGTTLTALQRLFENGLLSAAEKDLLMHAYIFYRKIEHVLQIEADTQTHSLSGKSGETERVASVLHFQSAADFAAQLNLHLERIRELYTTVFESAPAESETTPARMVSASSPADAFHALGFESADAARLAIRALTYGHFPKMHSNTTQKTFSGLLPLLLEEVSAVPDPDHTLRNFERIVSSHPFADGIYKTLTERPEALRILVHLASFSNIFTYLFCDAPSSLDRFFVHYPGWRTAAAYDPLENVNGAANMYAFKQFAWIRCLCEELWRTDTEICGNLTQLADGILRAVFDKYFPGKNAALIGLGKLGGSELSYQSDLDVVFVCRDSSDVDQAIVNAKLFLNEVAQTTPKGTLYAIDARLRPEGKQAPLVVTASRYRAYVESRGQFWERQSLIKARFVCGDEDLASDLIEFFRRQVYERSLTDDNVQALAEMRDRQIAEKIRTADDAVHDIKFSRGALLDIEYPVQALQMKFNIRTTNTLVAIRGLADAGKITDAELLTENYLFLRKLEKYNYLAFERKSHKIPNGEKQLAFLAKFCKLRTGNDVLERLFAVKKQNESFYHTLAPYYGN